MPYDQTIQKPKVRNNQTQFSIFMDEVEDLSRPSASLPTENQSNKKSDFTNFEIFCDDKTEIEDIEVDTDKNQQTKVVDNFSIFCDETKKHDDNDDYKTAMATEFSIFKDDEIGDFSITMSSNKTALPDPAPVPVFQDENKISGPKVKLRKSLFSEEQSETTSAKNKSRRSNGLTIRKSEKNEKSSNLKISQNDYDGLELTGIQELTAVAENFSLHDEETKIITASDKNKNLKIESTRKSIFSLNETSSETIIVTKGSKYVKNDEIISNPWAPEVVRSWNHIYTNHLKYLTKTLRFDQNLDLNKLRKNGQILLNRQNYKILSKHAEGNFARVYKLQNIKTGKVIAAKIQSPGFIYECFVSQLLAETFKDNHFYLKTVDSGHLIYNNASLLLSEFYPNGTLLDLINSIHRPNNGLDLKEKLSIAGFYSYHLIKIVRSFHVNRLIHADIKPDNFLLNVRQRMKTVDSGSNEIPAIFKNNIENYKPLIISDFGRMINCNIPFIINQNTRFSQPSKTDQFECYQMQKNLPYCYEIDYYALAATIYTLLFNEYLEIKEIVTFGRIDRAKIAPKKSLPRYFDSNWAKIFDRLLNAKNSVAGKPDLAVLDDCLGYLMSIDFSKGSLKFTKFLKYY